MSSSGKPNETVLIFDNEGECTPESLVRLLAGQAFGGSRDRPYDGQPWTANGLRGQTAVSGLTMRDVGDCIARAVAVIRTCGDADLDSHACIQQALCEIEKAMGIYPNIPEGPVRIPLLTLGKVPEPPKGAS